MNTNENGSYLSQNDLQDNPIDSYQSQDDVSETENRNLYDRRTTNEEKPLGVLISSKKNILPTVNASKQDYDEEDSELLEPEDKPRANIKKLITVEPILFLIMCAFSFQTSTTASLVAYKVCRVTFNYSESLCQDYNNDSEAANKIEKLADNLIMYKTLIETIPAVIYSLFLGSWSDKHGRKLPIMLPMLGYMCSAGGNVVLSYYMDTPPQYILINSIFVGMCGGMVSFMMGCFSYISDISTQKTRTKRIAIADLALFVGMPIGTLVGAQVYSHWGYMPVYAIGCGLCCITLIYSFVYLTESIHNETDGRKCGAFVDIFDLANVLSNFKIVATKRHGNKRLYINLMILSLVVLLFPLIGEGTVMLYYVRSKFHWDVANLGYYNAFSSVVTIIGTSLIFRFLFKKYRVPDLILGAIGFSGIVIKALITALSFASWMLYLSAAVSFFSFLGLPTVRSYTSKIVAKDEVGKLFAVMSSGESLAPILSSVVYSQLYSATRDTFSGAVFLLSAGLMTIPILIFAWIHFNQKKYDQYALLEDEKDINSTK